MQLVTLSQLQHYSYCPRQCALILVEQIFDENIYTIRVRREHERVHSEESGWKGDVFIRRTLPLFQDELGLIGQSDVVELHYDKEKKLQQLIPIEYKLGKRKEGNHNDVQLCGQALCLEFMFSMPVEFGYIFHISSQKRRKVLFSPELREETILVSQKIRELSQQLVKSSLSRRVKMPRAYADQRCPNCSLIDSCLPYSYKKENT